MVRPKLCRKIFFRPKSRYFKPQGISLQRLEEVILSGEEAEALKLKDFDGYEQTEAAEKMNTSQSTFQRVLSSARKKIAQAIVGGKALKIEE